MWLLSPLSWLLIVLLFGCVSFGLGSPGAGRWRRLLRWGCLAMGLACVFAMTPLFANLLLGRLETGFAVPAECTTTQPDTAIVLAGGVSAKPSGPDDLAVLALASRRRVDEAANWWRVREGRRLVMSGGSWFDNGIPESRLMARYAQHLGVTEAAISGEDASMTTWDSAQRLTRLRPALPRRIVLVTSAAHMPRAQYALHRAGFAVCPLATDRRSIPFEFPGAFIPQRSALEKSELGLHELVGLLYYRWLAFRQPHEGGK